MRYRYYSNDFRFDSHLVHFRFVCFFIYLFSASGMGVGRIFSRGGPKALKFVFYPSKLKKQPFFDNNFKIQGAKPSPAPPSDAHGLRCYI